MSKSDELRKIALITGSSAGLGYSIALGLARANIDVVLTGRNSEKLKEASRQIQEETTSSAYYHAANLDSPEAVTILYRYLQEHDLKICILVHNLGGALAQKDPLASSSAFEAVWRRNVGTQIDLNSLLIPAMIKEQWGRIVSVSSSFSIRGGIRKEPFGGSVQYAAAKAYLNTYNLCLARELAQFNVVVSTVLPGPLASPGKHWLRLKEKDPDTFNAFIHRHIPAARLGTYDDIVPLILLLTSEGASYYAGFQGNIDGGFIS